MTSWWYLSFVDRAAAGPSWLGGCYVRASGMVTACAEAHRLGCNPGGEAAVYGPFTDREMDEHVPEENRNRLLSREDLAQ